MSERDGIDEAFSVWRAATHEVAPAPALLDAVVRAARTAPPPTLSASLWSVGRPALWGFALGAVLLALAATRSWDRLADCAADAVELASVGP